MKEKSPPDTLDCELTNGWRSAFKVFEFPGGPIMLHLGIDQHRKQLTVSLGDEEGRVLIARQVSTQWDRVRKFFAEVRELSQPASGFKAIVEVCGFNDWLLVMLHEFGCAEIVLVQTTSRNRKKTDRRDAAKLQELLWINRGRLAHGERLPELRRVTIPAAEEAENRHLTKTLNKIQLILLRHNLQQQCPTRTLQTQKAQRWLSQLDLPSVDRLELNLLLAQWKLWDEQISDVERQIVPRQAEHAGARLIATIPGGRGYSALALASRVGDIHRRCAGLRFP
jgi:hypothetical protein